MKVWCAECYGKIRKSLLKAYGDYTLENIDMLTSVSEKGVNQIVYYPALKIRVPVKMKKGFSKSKTKVITPFLINYCPFCGKQTQDDGDEWDEVE